MNVIIIYNVDTTPILKKRIVEELKKIGYYDSWVYDSNEGKKKVFLPPNTLWKKDTEIKVPVQELKSILSNLNIPESNLLNCIAVPASPWNAIMGKQVEIV